MVRVVVALDRRKPGSKLIQLKKNKKCFYDSLTAQHRRKQKQLILLLQFCPILIQSYLLLPCSTRKSLHALQKKSFYILQKCNCLNSIKSLAFLHLSQNNDNYSTKFDNKWKNRRWCTWYSNQGQHDGRH